VTLEERLQMAQKWGQEECVGLHGAKDQRFVRNDCAFLGPILKLHRVKHGRRERLELMLDG
jgi:hypothetical protein